MSLNAGAHLSFNNPLKSRLVLALLAIELLPTAVTATPYVYVANVNTINVSVIDAGGQVAPHLWPPCFFLRRLEDADLETAARLCSHHAGRSSRVCDARRLSVAHVSGPNSVALIEAGLALTDPQRQPLRLSAKEKR